MRMEKKRILKEDGRYLVYYHFPDTASPEETAAFTEIHSVDAEAEQHLMSDTRPTSPISEEQPRV